MSVGGNEPVRMGVVELVMVRERAILVTTAKGRDVWIPHAAVHDDSEVYGIGTEGHRQTVGERGQLVLKRWYAEQKGWTT